MVRLERLEKHNHFMLKSGNHWKILQFFLDFFLLESGNPGDASGGRPSSAAFQVLSNGGCVK